METEFSRLPFRKRLEFNLAAFFGWWLVLILGATYRYRFEGAENLRRFRTNKRPFLLGIWHGRFWVFVYLFRRKGIVALVSQHLDGEMIARTLLRLGYRTVRGSSTRGGKEAFHRMVTALRQGQPGVVIPDGPRGPRHQLKPGIIYMAQQTGVPIIPLTFSARWAIRFNSWDRFVLPLPFSRVFVKVGSPFYVPSGADQRTLVRLKQELERRMVEQEREADAVFAS